MLAFSVILLLAVFIANRRFSIHVS
jgi:hypothetical protein